METHFNARSEQTYLELSTCDWITQDACYCQLRTGPLCRVFCQWLLLGVLNFALFLTLWAWRAVFSPALLCTGLLPSLTIVSASHSSRFYLVFQFHSLMVNIRYCAVSMPSVCIWCTVMRCDPLTDYRLIIVSREEGVRLCLWVPDGPSGAWTTSRLWGWPSAVQRKRQGQGFHISRRVSVLSIVC